MKFHFGIRVSVYLRRDRPRWRFFISKNGEVWFGKSRDAEQTRANDQSKVKVVPVKRRRACRRVYERACLVENRVSSVEVADACFAPDSERSRRLRFRFVRP